jgi:hypothetical protein
MVNNFKLLAQEEEGEITQQARQQLQQGESRLTSKLRFLRMIGDTVDLYSSRFAETMTAMMKSVPMMAEASARGMVYSLNELSYDSSSPLTPLVYIAITTKSPAPDQVADPLAHTSNSLEEILVQMQLPLYAYKIVSVSTLRKRIVLAMEERLAEQIMHSFRSGAINNGTIESIGWMDYQTAPFPIPFEADLQALVKRIKVYMATDKIGQAIDEALQYFKDKHEDIQNHFLAQKVELQLAHAISESEEEQKGAYLKVEQGVKRLLDRLP